MWYWSAYIGILFIYFVYFPNIFFLLYQILFLSGLAFIIGLRRTAHFFFQRQKLRSSAFFLGGVALVLLRWPRIGMLVETYGFVLLFKWVSNSWIIPCPCVWGRRLHFVKMFLLQTNQNAFCPNSFWNLTVHIA